MANNINKAEYLIIHHTATARDMTTFAAVKKYHISLGWGDIGYHYFITADGKITPGRSEQTVGAHCKASNMNFQSIGICLAGNFMNETPTVPQLNALLRLTTFLSGKYIIKKDNVLGHREVTNAKTLCPGDHLLDWAIKYRKEEQVPSQPSALNEAITHIEKALELLKTI